MIARLFYVSLLKIDGNLRDIYEIQRKMIMIVVSSQLKWKSKRYFGRSLSATIALIDAKAVSCG